MIFPQKEFRVKVSDPCIDSYGDIFIQVDVILVTLPTGVVGPSIAGVAAYLSDKERSVYKKKGPPWYVYVDRPSFLDQLFGVTWESRLQTALKQAHTLCKEKNRNFMKALLAAQRNSK